MTTGLPLLILFATILLLVLLRWAHRCWGKAILATIFAPLVAEPLGKPQSRGDEQFLARFVPNNIALEQAIR
jgi:hypothetical protein